MVHKITIKDNIKVLLAEDERCRNDDLYLILKYWTTYNGVNANLEIVGELAHTETIRRYRQKFSMKKGIIYLQNLKFSKKEGFKTKFLKNLRALDQHFK